MKKALLIILALTLCFALALPAFAASNTEKAAAEVLYEYGILQGKGTNPDGSPNLDLDAQINRVEALTLFVRLLGKEAEAKDSTYQTPFTDVPAWATGYVGYAYANSLTNGISTTLFGSNDPVSGAQFATFVLRALGYVSGTGADADFKWENAPSFANEIGAIKIAPNTQASLTRGKVAEICHSAIENAMMKNGTVSLKANIETNLGHKLGGSGNTGTTVSNSSIVGIWEEIDIFNIYTFNADGTGNEYYDGERWEMTWKLVGNTLTMDFGAYGVETYQITLNGDVMIVHGASINFEYIRHTRTASALVGVWEEIDIENVYTFNADGTGKEYYNGESWDMTWKLTGDTLTMNFGAAGIETYQIILSDNLLVVHGTTVNFEYVRYIRTATSIIGVWEEVDIDNIYTFNVDGTGKEYYNGTTYNMTWKLVGDTLTMNFGGGKIETYPVTLSYTYLILHYPDLDFTYIRQ